MKTDEQIAKDYSNKELDIIDGEYSSQSIENAVIYGLKKGRDIERIQFNDEMKSVIGDIQGEMTEKALRFAEFTSHDCDLWTKNPTTYKLLDKDGCRIGEPINEKQLYASKEFEQYLNGLKK